MTKEMFHLIESMDIHSAEMQVALSCAPFIAGLKTSNLLIVRQAQANDVWKIFHGSKFNCFPLYQGLSRQVLLLYADSLYDEFLTRPEVRNIFIQQGYSDFTFEQLLAKFAERYESFMSGAGSFPHEIGLFLGYPPEDVAGFMDHEGKDCLYTGYWKVYEHPLEKIELFHKFDRAKEGLVRLIAKGFDLAELLKYA